MNSLPTLLVLFGAGLGFGVLLFVGLMVAAIYRGRPGRRPRKVDGPFPRERIRLLKSAAGALGAEVVNDPASHRFPFLTSRPPAPPFGIALFPAEEGSRDASGPYIVRFEAPLRGGRFVEAWPIGSGFPPIRVNMASPEIGTGDPEFDASYVVPADDAVMARTVLGPEARALLSELQLLGARGRARLDLDPHRLRIQKEEQVSSPETLAAAARLGLRLLDAVRDALKAGQEVQFLDAPGPAALPSCPVCAAEIAKQDRVECRRCRTPHHRECWEYAGACSMFACREARYSL